MTKNRDYPAATAPAPACTAGCYVHDRLCELDGGHKGDCECPQCPSFLKRQRAEMIAGRAAAVRVYDDVISTAPDAE